jgi:hypothetical protein
MTSDAGSTPSESIGGPPTKTRLGRLLAFAVLAFLLFAGGILFLGFFDGVGWLRSLSAPPLAAAKGKVMLGQELLPRGQLMTKPIRGGGRGSMGIVDSNGEFVLKTDVNGTYVDGAEVGAHKVIVHAEQAGLSSGAAAPPSLVASKFTSFDTTPLTIEISSDPAKNVFTVVVEGNQQTVTESPNNADPDKSTKAAAEGGPESNPPEAK